MTAPDVGGHPAEGGKSNPWIFPSSPEWRCVRCGDEMPSREGGLPPIACPICRRVRTDLATCGLASTDERHREGCEDCDRGVTRFFPASWSKAKMDLYVEAALQDELAPENMTLQRAVSVLKTVLDHPDPFFHPSLILGAAQDHVIDLLNTSFYLIFSGGPDTGKGTANGCAMALCRDGIVLSSSSGPYLRDTLGNDRAVAISEFETLLKENKELLAVIRNGNRRLTAKVGLKIPAGKGWTNAEVNTFGFKSMDYHDRLDAHVLGRALQFEMVRSKELDIALNAEYLAKRLAPVRAWLAYRADLARKAGWTPERVEAVFESKEFRDRVKRFHNAWGRHGVIAAYLLLLNDIFQFGLEEIIRELMDAREPEMSELAQEVREAIDELVGDEPKPTDQLRENDIVARMNLMREERHVPPWKSGIKGPLRELGFNPKSQDWIPARKNWSGPHRGKAVVLPHDKVREWRKTSATLAPSAGLTWRSADVADAANVPSEDRQADSEEGGS